MKTHFLLIIFDTAPRFLIVLLALWSLILQCTATKLFPRIIGGAQTPDGKYSYTEMLKINDPVENRLWIGTLTLISNNVVIASTVDAFLKPVIHDSPENTDVKFGIASEFMSRDEHVYEVKSIIVHPNYNNMTLFNNIAVFIPNNTVPESVAKPIKIITDDEFAGLECTVTGFGQTVPKVDNALPGMILETKLIVGSNSYCKSNYRTLNYGEFCAIGVDGRGPCSDDGGGPVSVKTDSGEFVLLGINSRRSLTLGNTNGNCANAKGSDVHIRVSDYIDFIVESGNLDKSDMIFAKGATNEPSSPAEEGTSTESETNSSEESKYDESDISDKSSEGNDGNKASSIIYKMGLHTVVLVVSILYIY